MPIAASRLMTTFLKLPNCPSVPSRISVVLVDEANAGGTPGRECPCEDQYMRPLVGTTKPSSGDRV